jgi:hypothetical protein
LLERDHRRELEREARAAHLAFVIGDDIDAIEEDGLHGGLPGPDAERIIGERRIIGVEHERRTSIRVAYQVGVKHGSSHKSPGRAFAHRHDRVMTARRGTWGQVQ